MMSTHLRISTLAILFTLVIPAGAVNAGDEAPEVDVFAAALRAGTSISNAKTRAYTIERIALAWAHTDFCEEALVALRAGALFWENVQRLRLVWSV